jgi:hypothetical protein
LALLGSLGLPFDMTDRYILDRDKLYEEVWAEPMTKVSKRYQISDVALAKIFQKLDIPVPERGYWARVAHGQKPKQAPLPERSKDIPQQSEVHPVPPPQWKESIQAASLEAIHIPDTLASPHPLTTKLRKSLEKQKPDSYRRVSSSREDIDVQVGLESVPRLLRIVDAFVKASEERGYKFIFRERDRGLSILIDGQAVRFSFSESSRRTSLPPKDTYAAPEYTPTGKLTFKILEYIRGVNEPSWSDKVNSPLENRLAEILHALKQAALALREREEERAREAKLAEERAEDRRKAEIQHKKLSQDLADWSNAETLRRFVQRLEAEIEKDSVHKPEFAERWIDWVKSQAESLDPFSKGVEDFLDHYLQFGWDKMTRRR